MSGDLDVAVIRDEIAMALGEKHLALQGHGLAFANEYADAALAVVQEEIARLSQRRPLLCRLRLHRWCFDSPTVWGRGCFESCKRCRRRRLRLGGVCFYKDEA